MAVSAMHRHQCSRCGATWEHDPERACLAATRYACPACRAAAPTESPPIQFGVLR